MLTKEEVRKLLSAPPENIDWGIRDRALLALLYTAALRCSELSAIRIRDLDFLLNQVMAASRRIPFDEATADVLQRYIRTSQDQFASRDSLLFPGRGNNPMTRQGIWKLVRKYGVQAGIPSPVTPQLLRESRRAEWLGMGVPPERVAQMLGSKF